MSATSVTISTESDFTKYFDEFDSFEKFVDEVISHKSLLAGAVTINQQLVYPIKDTILNCLRLKEARLNKISLVSETDVQAYSTLLDRIQRLKSRLDREAKVLQNPNLERTLPRDEKAAGQVYFPLFTESKPVKK